MVGQGHLHHGRLADEADHDVGFAAATGGNQPARRHAGHRIGESIVTGGGGDVLVAAIAPDGPHADLLLLAGHHDALGRPYLQSGHGWWVCGRFWSTVFQPVLQQIVRRRIDLEAFAAAVLHRQAGLEQENATLRIGHDDTPALGTLDDLRVVESRIEAEQAQPEAVLALLTAVAGALVAAGLGQHRHDLAREIHW